MTVLSIPITSPHAEGLYALIKKWEENQSIWRKTLEAQERSVLSYETYHTRLGFSDKRHKAQTIASPMLPKGYFANVPIKF